MDARTRLGWVELYQEIGNAGVVCRRCGIESELPVGSRHEEGSVVQAAEKHTESHFELETTHGNGLVG